MKIFNWVIYNELPNWIIEFLGIFCKMFEVSSAIRS